MLDIKTLMLLYLIINVINAGAVAIMWSQNRGRFAGISFWLIDMILQAVGSALIVLRGLLPDLLSITLANALILAGALFIFMGLERFIGRKGRQIQNYVLLVFFIAVDVYFLVIQPNLTVREIALSVVLLVYTIQCCWLLLRRADPGIRSITRLTGIVFAGYAAFSLARIILLSVFPARTSNFFQSGAVDALAITAYVVLSVCIIISLVVMVNRRLLAEVSAQEGKFAKAFQSSPYAIVLSRPSDGAILEVNEGFVRITGYQYAEVIGKSSLGLNLWVHEEDRLAVVNGLAQGCEIQGLEYQFRKKTGEALTGLFSASLVTINNDKCILASIGDITERKRAERQSKQRMKELQAFFSLAEIAEKEGITLSELYQEFVRILPASWQYSEIACARIVIGENEYHTDNFAESAWKQSAPVKADGSVVGSVEVSYLQEKPEEEEGPFLKEERLLINAIAERLGRIAERKQLEERIRQVRSDLLFSVSHDLKAPLQILRQTQEMLNVLTPGEGLVRFQEYSSIWRRNLQRLERMINNLIDSQRGEEGRFPLFLGPCDPVEIIERVVEDLTGYALSFQVTLDLHLQHVPQGSCDEEALGRVVENLLTNAVKFSPNGGQVAVRLGMEGDTLLLEVEDHGAGIPAAEIPQLFQPFQRGRSAQKKKGIPGTGLGLYVCRRIIEEHGGTLSLRSEEGKGAVLTMRLPWRKATEERDGAPRSHENAER